MIIKLPDVSNSKNIFFIGDKGETLITCKKNSYIQLTFTIRVFDFGGLHPDHTVTQKYKCMSFKGNVTVLLGEIVESYFIIPSQLKDIINLSTLNDLKSIPLTRPLECDILFEEIDYTSNEKLSELQVNNLRFLCGPSNGFINTSNQLNVGRCNANSLVSYSVYVDKQETFNLNSEEIIIDPNVPNSIICRVSSSEQIILKDSEGQKLSEKWIIPDGLQSIYIFWLDENLSLSFFEFTGKFEIKDIITYVNSSAMSKGIEISRNLTNFLKKECVINTGYLFKSDILKIESILISKKCWISFDQGKNFSSFTPFTKELTYDSQDPLYHFNIEIYVNDDAENHETIKDEYNLIFDYYDNGELADFTAAFDQLPSKVNWGDTTINNEITHSYKNTGSYTVKMNISQLTKINFSFKNITGFTKIPYSVDKIDCYGCRLDATEIKKLLLYVNSVKQSNSEIIFTGSNNSFFSKYIIVSMQQEPVVLDEEAIAEAQKLIKKYWFVDYTCKRNPSTPTLTSRYSISDNYNKYYPSDHNLLLAPAKPYFFSNEEIQLNFSVYKSYGPDWEKYDWECFVYPRIDILEEGVWKVKNKAEYPTKADAQILFNLGLLNEGAHTVRGVQQSKPQLVYEERIYDLLKTTLLEFDVISPESVYIRKNPETGWKNNTLKISSSVPYINFYPFGFINYCGMGEKIGYESSAILSTTLSKEQLKDNTLFITEQAGNYSFSFKNYIVDFSELIGYLSSVVFYLAYISPSNETVLSSPLFIDNNGKIILNKDMVISDVPVGSYICPLISADIRPDLSEVTGNWYINNFSRLIIKKL